MAEQLNTTPWDIRQNMTKWDMIRLSMANEARNEAEQLKTAQDRASNTAQSALRSGKR